MSESVTIRAIDAHSVHRITSGQVVIDLQTAVKELVENSLDAGATLIEVRFHNNGLKRIEVVDNGSGIAPQDHDSIALKHYTSKLSSFGDLSHVHTFGFRGEALSSLCALTDGFTITTATSSEAPMGTIIEMDRNGKTRSKGKIARQRGTTITVSNLFKPLPVRRKELERNSKREFQKALNLLHAYALVPCALENKGVRLTVSNQTEGGRKVVQFKTDGALSIRASVLAVWGSKALENIVDLDLSFDVETEKSVQKRLDLDKDISVVTPVKVQGLISKFAVGAGRTSVDRQFFFVNGRPYNPGKVQKAINEVYRTFNANQSPFIIANVILPTNACDINVSPDKRTIFLHSEGNLIQALKTALEAAFSSSRSTYDVTAQPSGTQVAHPHPQPRNPVRPPPQTRGRDGGRGEKRQHGPTSPNPDGPPELGGTSSHPPQPGETDGTASRDEPITMGVPHLLLEGGVRVDEEVGSHLESEPEPTLVAQPRSNGKSVSSGARDGVDRMTDHPRSRAPSEPLFFPESGEEEGNDTAGRVDNEKEGIESGRNGATRLCPPQAGRSATIATSSTTASTSTSMTTVPHIARSSTDMPGKPRSVQTVLSTRGAAWNIRKGHDVGVEDRREPKRARLSSEGDRVGAKKSFRSSLSQFLGTGKKALPDEKEEDSGSESKSDDDRDGIRRGGDHSEVDELDEESGSKECSRKSKKKRPRAGSGSSQVTMIVPSDDECAMDVDEPSSTATKPSRPAVTSSPQRSLEGVAQVEDEIPSEDEWAFSSTLVGTYIPPAGKAVEPPPDSTSARPPAEMDTDLVTLRVNLVSIGSYYLDVYNRLPSSSESMSTPPAPTPSASLRSAVSSANLETAAEDTIASAALSRIISKADFEHMTIVGQFNLGFIIVRKRSDTTLGGETMDDLFIVDQHAADEKWNFETLQEKTVIASQKLFRPQQLQLTAADEMLAVENMSVLKLNGFELEQVEEQEISRDEDGDESGVRIRLQLVAQPMSKDTVFDIKDLEELLHLMQDRPKGTMVRCSKVRAMFAMRACRRSVMIGKALDKTRMMAIIRHMGTMDQPWNCPHGRPTMRHLSDLRSFGQYAPPRRAIDWEAYEVHGSRVGKT